MAADIINNNLVVNGDLSATTMTLPANAVVDATVSASAAIGRAKLALEQKKYDIPFTDLRIWDAFVTPLTATGNTDDLGLVGGTFGTASQMVQTGDVKTLTATRYARFQVRLPAEYDSAGTVTLRASAGMVTTVASTTATIDFEVYESNKTGGIGADICSTSATTINSLTFGDKDFSITASGLVAGDLLDVRMAIATVDGATGTAVIGAVGSLELLCQVRG